MSKRTYRLAFNIEKRRPGCVLIQAAMGGDVPDALFYDLFPAETWEVGASGMQVFESTEEQLRQASRIARETVRRDDD